jgi:hypothetical protein
MTNDYSKGSVLKLLEASRLSFDKPLPGKLPNIPSRPPEKINFFTRSQG